MIYGIEESTDSRFRDTKIVKFRDSQKHRALAWAQEPLQFAHPCAADTALHPRQQNWHKRIRSIYGMPEGWRPPSKKQLEKEAFMLRHYNKTSTDMLADHVWRDGKRIDE